MDKRAPLVEVVAAALLEKCDLETVFMEFAPDIAKDFAKVALAALAALAPECERCGGSGRLRNEGAEKSMLRWHEKDCPDCNGTGKSKNLAIFPVSGEVRLVEQVGWQHMGKGLHPSGGQHDHLYAADENMQPVVRLVPLEGS